MYRFLWAQEIRRLREFVQHLLARAEKEKEQNEATAEVPVESAIFEAASLTEGALPASPFVEVHPARWHALLGYLASSTSMMNFSERIVWRASHLTSLYPPQSKFPCLSGCVGGGLRRQFS